MDETYQRSFAFALDRAAAESDGLTLEGYAAVFNSPTRISDWRGEYDEQIMPGAFAKTLRESTPIIQFDHGQHPLMGSLPIAVPQKVREDRRGLFVRARVFDNWMTEPLRDAIRAGAVDGMSIRFSVVKDDEDRSGDVPFRSIHEVKLYEMGPVVWPAYRDTSVALRSLQRALPDLSLGTSEEPAPDSSSDAAATSDPHPEVVRDQARRRAEARRLIGRSIAARRNPL